MRGTLRSPLLPALANDVSGGGKRRLLGTAFWSGRCEPKRKVEKARQFIGPRLHVGVHLAVLPTGGQRIGLLNCVLACQPEAIRDKSLKAFAVIGGLDGNWPLYSRVELAKCLAWYPEFFVLLAAHNMSLILFGLGVGDFKAGTLTLLVLRVPYLRVKQLYVAIFLEK
jgi:hypothetical protein